MHVAEFTLHPKRGHFEEVAEIPLELRRGLPERSSGAADVLILGDEASGVVRGIGVFTDRDAADSVNSDPECAAFNDRVGPSWRAPRSGSS
jgi:quinol monooxygenase YgiN